MLGDHFRKVYPACSSTIYISRFEKVQDWICTNPGCTRSFPSEEILKNHIREKHRDQGPAKYSALLRDYKSRYNRNKYKRQGETKVTATRDNDMMKKSSLAMISAWASC